MDVLSFPRVLCVSVAKKQKDLILHKYSKVQALLPAAGPATSP